MKVLASIALCLAACVPALAAEPALPRQSAGSLMPPARAPQPTRVMPQPVPLQEAANSSWTTARHESKPAANMAFLLTDDADSMRLPAFATRTTPLPTRFMRLGVEWSF